MLPDLNRLKVFYYVFRCRSIVAAAEHLHLSQPAVSQQLQKLEAELRMLLFTRLHKKLVPTVAGERLYQLMEPFLIRLEAELADIRRPQNRPAGPLRIGSPRQLGEEYLPRFCQAFRQRYPEVVFHLKFKEALPLLTMLREGQLDFALVDVYFTPGELPGFPNIFSIDPLLREEMILVCSRSYYQQKVLGDHSYEQLIRQEFIADEDDPSILDLWFNHHFQKIPENLDIVMTIDSHEALISSLKLGMGLGVATAHLIWDEIQRGELIPVGTMAENMVNMISLVQLQDKVPTLTEKTFRTFIFEALHSKEILERFQRVGRANESGRPEDVQGSAGSV